MSSVDQPEKPRPGDEPESGPRLSLFRALPRMIDISNSFIIILLRSNQNNVPGMILLQDNDEWSPQANVVSRLNSHRICTLAEKSHRERVGAKPLRMIFLQNRQD
jgi:hypothetical protein